MVNRTRNVKTLLYASLIVLVGLPPVFAQALEIEADALREVRAVQARYEDDFFQVPGVVGVGIGKKSGNLVFNVFVDEEAPLSQIATNIEGIRVETILIPGGFTASDGPPGSDHRRQYGFPVPMGVSTSNGLGCFAGTLGFKACDAANPNLVGYITNNHVAAAGGSNLCPNQAPIGTPQYHRGTADASCGLATEIGRLLRYHPLNLTFPPEDPVVDSRIDAAFVQSLDSQISDTILDIGTPSATPRALSIGDMVRKSGRSTGLTTGVVRSVNVTAIVKYDNMDGALCGKARFANQILIDPATPPDQFLDPGDSGSPLVDVYGNPVGLVYAGGNGGGGIASPIGDVLSLLNVRFDCTAWSSWEALGGNLTSVPAAVSWGGNRLDLFVRGIDNALWHKWWDGGWSIWENLGGNLTSPPVVVSWGVNRLDVFIRGIDNALWHKWWDGARWSDWEYQGGVLVSTPTVISRAVNRLDVFVQGADGSLYQKFWSGTGWSNWINLGGTVSSRPAAVSRGPNSLDVFVRSADGSPAYRSWNGTTWENWVTLDGFLASSPTVVSRGPASLDLFVEGGDHSLYHKWWDGVQWNSWENLGGVLVSPSAPIARGANRLDVFVQGANGSVYQIFWSGIGWSAWTNLEGSVGSVPTVTARGTSLDLFVRGSNDALYHRVVE